MSVKKTLFEDEVITQLTNDITEANTVIKPPVYFSIDLYAQADLPLITVETDESKISQDKGTTHEDSGLLTIRMYWVDFNGDRELLLSRANDIMESLTANFSYGSLNWDEHNVQQLKELRFPLTGIELQPEYIIFGRSV